MRDTDRHGAWSNNDQCYEDGTESHICGKRCEAPKPVKTSTHSEWVDNIVCG